MMKRRYGVKAIESPFRNTVCEMPGQAGGNAQGAVGDEGSHLGKDLELEMPEVTGKMRE